MKKLNKYNISLIKFPVYQLPKERSEYYWQDGILWHINGKVFDDTNQLGDTLGMRRLRTSHKLARLNKSIHNIAQFIKQAGTKKFIDSNGLVFTYEKVSYERLKSYKIKSVINKSNLCVVHLHGIETPFILRESPGVGAVYASVLNFEGHPWLIYQYTDESLKDALRKL